MSSQILPSGEDTIFWRSYQGLYICDLLTYTLLFKLIDYIVGPLSLRNKSLYSYQETLLKQCYERPDDWLEKVCVQILSVHDVQLMQFTSQTCSVNFRTGKCMPHTFSDKNLTKKEYTKRPRKKNSISGRPTDDDRCVVCLNVANMMMNKPPSQIWWTKWPKDTRYLMVPLTDLHSRTVLYCET